MKAELAGQSQNLTRWLIRTKSYTIPAKPHPPKRLGLTKNLHLRICNPNSNEFHSMFQVDRQQLGVISTTTRNYLPPTYSDLIGWCSGSFARDMPSVEKLANSFCNHKSVLIESTDSNTHQRCCRPAQTHTTWWNRSAAEFDECLPPIQPTTPLQSANSSAQLNSLVFDD